MAAPFAKAEDAEPGAVRAPFRVALLGTSLTKNGGWDAALAQRLSSCLGRPVEALNFGGAGRTSRWGLAQTGRVIAARPDVVAIEFSANDASLLKGFSLSESVANAQEIARRLRAGTPRPKLVFLAMNPMHGLRGWARPWLENYYDAYGPLSRRVGARYLDLRPHWRSRGRKALRIAIADGVHPSKEAAAEVIPPLLAQAIAEQFGEDCRNVDREM